MVGGRGCVRYEFLACRLGVRVGRRGFVGGWWGGGVFVWGGGWFRALVVGRISNKFLFSNRYEAMINKRLS